MRGGLVTSVMLHAAILGWALFTIQAQRELRVAEPEPIAVDLVNASELTRLRQGARTAKQMEAEAKETPKAEPAKPHQHAELEAKFMQLGVPVWGETVTRRLLDGCMKLEEVADFSLFSREFDL